MEIRHLRYFIAVAEELQISRAAERLHIELSPLSRAIKELQEDLGVKLFVRTTRSTRMTQAGKLFLEHASMHESNPQGSRPGTYTWGQAARNQMDVVDKYKGAAWCRLNFIATRSRAELLQTNRTLLWRGKRRKILASAS